MGKTPSFVRLAAVCVALTQLAGTGSSRFPGAPGSDPWTYRPNDPRYPEMWQLFSHLPVDHEGPISELEREIGSGMHVDRAWQLHTGSPEVVIAVLDSGINWDDRDLIERHALNVGELPLPEGSMSYDRNGDGRVSAADYAEDSRVWDANGNGVLDAGDLIAIFSDGIDSDGNGFVDDIAGWDFHENDNDPGDRIRFGHGTGEAKDSVGALDNGIGLSGICGNCSFIALRVDDSFVINADAFSRAVIYAVDNGVSLIQQALGSANWNPYTQAAIDYAYEKGVAIIGSAADENSYHHNYPSTLDPVVYTNSIRYDTREPNQASTFLNFNNCSNYGARVDVATSGRSCSSEATANLSGIAGLALSYAKSLGKPLSPGELISLIKATATDIALGPAGEDSFRHPSYPGWDTLTGYGRTHAYEMLLAIKEDRIPPEARIVTPRWFEIVTPDPAGIPVTIQARSPRSGQATIKLEVARGVETSASSWVTIHEAVVGAKGVEGEFARVPLAVLRNLPRMPLDAERNRDAYTLRLTVADGNGAVGEARRTVFLFDDPDLMPGFPVALGASGESAGLFVDLDGDGREEYVVADGGGLLHAFQGDGGELAGFPVPVAPSRFDSSSSHSEMPRAHAAVFAPIAAGDLTGDGRMEIVAVTYEGHLSVVDAEARRLAGFPVELPAPEWDRVNPEQIVARGSIAAPVLADLTGDGKLEVIVMGMDGQVHVYDAHGRPVSGFPLPIEVDGVRARLVSSPALVDVDRDGVLDLVFGSNHSDEAVGHLFAVSGLGLRAARPVFAGFPTRLPVIRDKILPTIGTGVPTAPVVGDVDGDGEAEIIVHAFIGKAYVFSLDGTIERSLDLTVGRDADTREDFMLPAFGHPSLADLDGDGRPEILGVGAGRRMLVNLMLGGRRFDFDHLLGAWDGATGAMLRGFPRKTADMLLAPSPIAADVDGDGKIEAIVGTSGYYVHAFGPDGEASGYPKFTGGWMFGSPALGDMDGDGLLELAGTTREGYLFVWKTRAKAAEGKSKLWRTFKGDAHRSGVWQ